VYERNARAYTQKYAREYSPTSETVARFIGMCEDLAVEMLTAAWICRHGLVAEI
jgi:hypothetical protein